MRCPSRGRQHDSNMRGMMVIFFSICLQRGVKNTMAYIQKVVSYESITVKMKMLVSGWDQEWLKVSFFFFLPHLFSFSQNA